MDKQRIFMAVQDMTKFMSDEDLLTLMDDIKTINESNKRRKSIYEKEQAIFGQFEHLTPTRSLLDWARDLLQDLIGRKRFTKQNQPNQTVIPNSNTKQIKKAKKDEPRKEPQRQDESWKEFIEKNRDAIYKLIEYKIFTEEGIRALEGGKDSEYAKLSRPFHEMLESRILFKLILKLPDLTPYERDILWKRAFTESPKTALIHAIMDLVELNARSSGPTTLKQLYTGTYMQPTADLQQQLLKAIKFEVNLKRNLSNAAKCLEQELVEDILKFESRAYVDELILNLIPAPSSGTV